MQDNQATLPVFVRENLNRRHMFVNLHCPLGKSRQAANGAVPPPRLPGR